MVETVANELKTLSKLSHLSLGSNDQVRVTLADAHLQQNLVHPLDHLPNVRNFAIIDQWCTHPNIEQQWKERLLPWRQPGGLEVEVELDELGVHVVDVQLERNPAEVEDVAGIQSSVEAVQIPELDLVDVSERNLGEDVVSRKDLTFQSLLECLGFRSKTFFTEIFGASVILRFLILRTGCW